MYKSLKAEFNSQKKQLETKERTMNSLMISQGYPQYIEGRRVYGCKMCEGKYFESERSLVGHYKRRHPYVKDIPVAVLKTDINSITPQMHKTYTGESRRLRGKIRDLESQIKSLKDNRKHVKESEKEEEIERLKILVKDLSEKLVDIDNLMLASKESREKEASQIKANLKDSSHEQKFLTVEAPVSFYQAKPNKGMDILMDPQNPESMMSAVIDKYSFSAKGKRLNRSVRAIQRENNFTKNDMHTKSLYSIHNS